MNANVANPIPPVSNPLDTKNKFKENAVLIQLSGIVGFLEDAHPFAEVFHAAWGVAMEEGKTPGKALREATARGQTFRFHARVSSLLKSKGISFVPGIGT